MIALRAILVMVLVTGMWAADGRALADREYVTALSEFQQAEIEHSVGEAEAVRRHLAAARQARTTALAAYRALGDQPDSDVVIKRCVELDQLGKVCCGRVSLWTSYANRLVSGGGRNEDHLANDQ